MFVSSSKAIERLKLATKQYSKYQEKWLRMRLLQRVEEHSPDVYELDTTDISAWQENVEKKAEQIIQAFLKVIFKEEEKKTFIYLKTKIIRQFLE